MIYISTGGMKNYSAWQASELLLDRGIKNIELSGGLSDPDNLGKLKNLSKNINFQIHNYFPPPENPFVFNLASLNPKVSQLSYDHARNAINWAVELGSDIYSFHSGFLIDPKVDELGKKINNKKLFNRKQSMSMFINKVNELAIYSKDRGIDLLIENNVISEANYNEFNCNPLLMTSAEECLHVMENTPQNVNLLIDVAHLKVSANSLNFNPHNFLNECHSWIKGYHLSDNDGKSDTNNTINEKSWFWNYLKSDVDFTIEVYNKSAKELKILLDFVNNKIRP